MTAPVPVRPAVDALLGVLGRVACIPPPRWNQSVASLAWPRYRRGAAACFGVHLAAAVAPGGRPDAERPDLHYRDGARALDALRAGADLTAPACQTLLVLALRPQGDCIFGAAPWLRLPPFGLHLLIQALAASRDARGRLQPAAAHCTLCDPAWLQARTQEFRAAWPA